jgi:hypothetical protein
MVTENYYMPGQAAKMLGITEDEVLHLIQDGKLRAEYRDNIGSYMIPHSEILQRVRQSKNLGALQKMVGQRILLCDRDQNLQSLIKMEVGRKPGVSVRVATSERDMAILIDEFLPDLILMHVAAAMRARDRVQECLKKAKGKSNSYIILYSDSAPQVAKDNKPMQEAIKAIGPDEVVSIYAGTRPLMLAISKRLG